MDTSKLKNYIQYKYPFTQEDIDSLERLVDKYPWFSIGNQLLLKAYKESDNKKFKTALPKVSLLTPNRRKLYFFLQKKAESTDLAVEFDIEGHIETLPKRKRSQSDDDLLMNFSNEYFTLEDIEANNSPNSPQNEIITKFIEINPRIIPPIKISDAISADILSENITEEEPVSEILAEIYISQKLFDKAESCYKKLSLLNPEKSTYFADLISKLKINK